MSPSQLENGSLTTRTVGAHARALSTCAFKLRLVRIVQKFKHEGSSGSKGGLGA